MVRPASLTGAYAAAAVVLGGSKRVFDRCSELAAAIEPVWRTSAT